MQIDMEFEIHNLEQIAYAAVLRAFKAQSDALTWEKEGLITELRKELKVSDDEHRVLLSEVNSDDLIRRIREWREAGGNRNVGQNVPQHISNQLQSPTVSASRKRTKSNPFGAPALHPPSMVGTAPPVSSAMKWGPSSGIGGRRPYTGQPAYTPAVQYPHVDHVSSAAPLDEPPETVTNPLIGRRVMIRWPADNNFYEAVISEYNPVDGRHALVYDRDTPNETVEWVNIKEIRSEDIRWVGIDPLMSQLGEANPPAAARVRPISVNELANEKRAAQNEVQNEDSEEIEILHTDTLIKKVEKILDASHPDLLEISRAKQMLKEHEQTLIEVIAKLTAACASEDERPSSQGDSLGRPHNVNNRQPSNDVEGAAMVDS